MMDEAEIDAAFAQIEKARDAIVANLEEQGDLHRSITDSIPCPVCEIGTLRYRYAGKRNGHIHAACTTPECVSWVE